MPQSNINNNNRTDQSTINNQTNRKSRKRDKSKNIVIKGNTDQLHQMQNM